PTLITVSCFLNDPSTPEIYTLSLHDALPISEGRESYRMTDHGCQDCHLHGAAERRNGGRFPQERCRSFRQTASTARGHSCRTMLDRKSTRLNSSHVKISYAVFCLKKKNKNT